MIVKNFLHIFSKDMEDIKFSSSLFELLYSYFVFFDERGEVWRVKRRASIHDFFGLSISWSIRVVKKKDVSKLILILELMLVVLWRKDLGQEY